MSTRSERRDGLDGVCTTDGLAARLGQPEVLHLALLNQFLHGAGNVLDGDTRVHAVLIQHIDSCHVQALQHRVDNLTNVLRPALDAVARAVRIDPESKLRRNDDAFAETARARRRRVLHS